VESSAECSQPQARELARSPRRPSCSLSYAQSGKFWCVADSSAEAIQYNVRQDAGGEFNDVTIQRSQAVFLVWVRLCCQPQQRLTFDEIMPCSGYQISVLYNCKQAH